MASLSPDTCPDQFKRKERRLTTTDEKTASSSSSSQQNQRNKRIKRWRTQREQHIYSSKLVQALRRSRRSSSTSAAKDARQTADTVLAVLAKGTTRWSREILTARTTTTKHKKAKIAVNANTRPRKMPEIIKTEKRKAPAVERKLKVLGRLIPGGRKLTFSNLLEETSDYIAALEMQVRAMTAITELLAGGAGGAGPQPPADRIDSNVNS